jgi:very-short-patch-repair endonuclease
LEKSIRQILDGAGIRYIQEAPIGRYSVDFLLPDLRIALEVDGVYWHQDGARDKRKTVFLERKGWAVARVTDSELDESNNPTALVLRRLQTVANLNVPSLPPSFFDDPNWMVGSAAK